MKQKIFPELSFLSEYPSLSSPSQVEPGALNSQLLKNIFKKEWLLKKNHSLLWMVFVEKACPCNLSFILCSYQLVVEGHLHLRETEVFPKCYTHVEFLSMNLHLVFTTLGPFLLVKILVSFKFSSRQSTNWRRNITA